MPGFCFNCATPLPEEGRYCTKCGTDNSGDTARSLSLHAATPDPHLEQKVRAELGDQYQPERELGRGGMGVVFLATERRLGRRVAIKVLPPSVAGDAVSVERFLREARTAATLDHPHIIPIYRVSDSGALHWFTMKYVEGESLAAILDREGALAVDRAASIIEQVADALHYANTRGVIHRDVKPGNVMISVDGWVTVTDFGIAKAAGTQSLTGSGSMMGTPYYMSPEQCAGTELTPAADQYSLAVLSYKMLCGSLPFSGETAVDIIKKHCFDPPPSILTFRPDLPTAVASVLDRALRKGADERFVSVKEFAGALLRAARGQEVTVAKGGSARQAVPRRRRASWTLAVGAVLVVGAVIWRPWAAPEQTPSGRDTTSAPIAAAPPAAAPQQTPADSPRTTTPPPRVSRPQVTPTAAVATGYVTVGSTTPARLAVNGKAAPSNPVFKYAVPAGTVQLRFTVTDSVGTWTYDTTVAVAPNETRNVGRVRLVRP